MKTDAWDYTRDESLRLAALLIFFLAFVAGAVWAVVQTVRGFVEGVLQARTEHYARKEASAAGETPFPDQPRPAARPVPPAQARNMPEQNYTVDMDRDGEVTVNGLPIGHVDASPWQFCSYDAAYGNGPARATKEQAWDDACDYAESVVRSA